MIQISRFRLLGLVASLVAAVSMPLTASAASRSHSTHHASPHIVCGADYIVSNGTCTLNLSSLGLVGAADTPDVAIVHIGAKGYAGAALDSEIDSSAIEIVAPSTSPADAAAYVVQQLHLYAEMGQSIRVVVTVGGTNALDPAYQRAISTAISPIAEVQIGGSNVVDGTRALADALQIYQRGGISAVRENLPGLAAVATYGYGTLLWPPDQH